MLDADYLFTFKSQFCPDLTDATILEWLIKLHSAVEKKKKEEKRKKRKKRKKEKKRKKKKRKKMGKKRKKKKKKRFPSVCISVTQSCLTL